MADPGSDHLCMWDDQQLYFERLLEFPNAVYTQPAAKPLKTPPFGPDMSKSADSVLRLG